MKRSNKILVSILLVICIIIFVLTYYILYVGRDVPESVADKELSGEKLTEGLYKYDLDVGDYNNGITVYNNVIYYWEQIDDNYIFYKRDIYTNKNEKLGTFDSKNYYCYFEDNYIDCSNDDNKKMFNYDFKKIYDGEQKTIVPYKDDLLTIEKDKAYFKNKEYKKLDTDLTNYNM